MFFHPPKDLSTSVFARLPEEFRKADSNNEWARYQPKGSPARSLLEGPSFDRNGHLWCVDLPNGRIYRITLDGEFHVAAEYDGDYHRSDRRRFVKDIDKIGIAEDEGWIVIRVVSEHRPRDIVNRVYRGLARRGWHPDRRQRDALSRFLELPSISA